MSRSLRTDPYPLRAARRARDTGPVRVRAARPGFVHPANPADIRQVLAFFGPAATYGVRGVELRQRPPGAGAVAVAALRVPGIVLLYEQPEPPWVLPGRLTDPGAARLRRAGAIVTAGSAATRVDWPGGELRDFMLFDGLMHELGHHVVQQEARRRRTPAMRTADHERRADAYAVRARAAWAAAW
ncbi:hypothetical protein [Dactylosporangium sp. CA-139066]|uniref:hypothetical protein n=1 Tax=Dactylosporangium sp. CA-139066 TaxID=3239930 RepID=UPI003D94937B